MKKLVFELEVEKETKNYTKFSSPAKDKNKRIISHYHSPDEIESISTGGRAPKKLRVTVEAV